MDLALSADGQSPITNLRCTFTVFWIFKSPVYKGFWPMVFGISGAMHFAGDPHKSPCFIGFSAIWVPFLWSRFWRRFWQPWVGDGRAIDLGTMYEVTCYPEFRPNTVRHFGPHFGYLKLPALYTPSEATKLKKTSKYPASLLYS
jgi:hypothetical protein